MRKKILLLSVFMAALFTIGFVQDKTAAANDDALLAKWEIVIAGPGQDILGSLTLEKDGDEFKGAIVTEMGDAPFKNVKVTENSFTADISTFMQGQSFDGTANGKLEDGKLSGIINLSGIGEIPYTGKKAE